MKKLAMIFILLSMGKTMPILAQTLPVLTTTPITYITQNTAKSGGNITSDGGLTITARGVCWGTNNSPTIADSKSVNGTGAGGFTSSITGLTANTTYYARAYATNSIGTGYGSVVVFITDGARETITDIDGNVYHTVAIGTQTWMVENLKTTKYRNGDYIPNVTEYGSWSGLTTGAYCNYNNIDSNVATYGRLYNWYAVIDNRKISPFGWHVPTDSEWIVLINYLGGASVAGGKLKETGIVHWASPNNGADNTSGFTALPGGCCYFNSKTFYNINNSGYWWSTTELAKVSALYMGVGSDGSGAGCASSNGKRAGFSVRCIKDAVTTSIQGSKGILGKYSLSQNYPNPFNPSTTITYTINEPSLVTIKIFDVFGQTVETLINEKHSTGKYNVKWEPKNLPSGVYFYQLRTGKYNEVRKMVYMR